MKQKALFRTRAEAEAFALANGIAKKVGVVDPRDGRVQYHKVESVPAVGTVTHSFTGGPSLVEYDDQKISTAASVPAGAPGSPEFDEAVAKAVAAHLATEQAKQAAQA